LDEGAHHVGEAADGRGGPDQGADRRLVGIPGGFGLPASDGGGRDPEEASDLRLGEAEKALDAQNAVSELGAVMRSSRLVDLVEVLPEDRGDFLESAKEDVVELRFPVSLLESLAGAASFGELQAEGETKKPLGMEERLYGARRKATLLRDGSKDRFSENVSVWLNRHRSSVAPSRETLRRLFGGRGRRFLHRHETRQRIPAIEGGPNGEDCSTSEGSQGRSGE
jgi:hypothetical protein